MSSASETFIVPAGKGHGLRLRKGELLKVTTIEGPQVADMTFIAADDHHEGFNTSQSVVLNMMHDSGDLKTMRYLYSKPPFERLMATIVEDTVRTHFVWSGARCSRGIFALRSTAEAPDSPQALGITSCQENLEAALSPFKVPPYAIPDVLNVFMENDDEETARTGRMAFRPSPATVDDYVTIQAEMDLLVGVSACPAYKSPVNAGVSKPLLLEIFPAPAE